MAGIPIKNIMDKTLSREEYMRRFHPEKQSVTVMPRRISEFEIHSMMINGASIDQIHQKMSQLQLQQLQDKITKDIDHEIL